MIIENIRARRRVVLGWEFLRLSVWDYQAILDFLATGDTELLPKNWQLEDYSIYLKE